MIPLIQQSMKCKKIAVTGGIGSGKSKVMLLLKSLGYATCDADILSRLVMANTGVQSQLRATFGEEIFSSADEIDRSALGKIVFNNAAFKKKLEDIVHPAIAFEFSKKLNSLQENFPGAWLFYEAALILEASRQADFDAVILISANEALRFNRLLKNRGMSFENAQQVMQSQMSDAEKRHLSDFEIDNSGNENSLFVKVEQLVEQLRDKFSSSNS